MFRGSGGFRPGFFWCCFGLFRRRFSSACLPLFLASFLHLSCIGQEHCRRAGRNGARPPTRCELSRTESPVSCWESSSVRPGSRRVGGVGAIVTPSKSRFPRSLLLSSFPAIGCRPPNGPRPFRQRRGSLGGFCFSFATKLKR